MSSNVEKLNKKIIKKRIIFIVRLTIIVILLISAAIIAVRSAYRIKKVSVVNSTEYDTALIMQTLGKAESEPILFFDSASWEKKLKTDFPYIKEIKIKVGFPDKLNAVIYYDTPVYSLFSNDLWFCLNSDLKILEISTEKKEKTLTINGILLSDYLNYQEGQIIDSSVDIETILISEIKNKLVDFGLFDRVTLLDFEKKYNIVFVLDDLITVELGNSSELEAKFKMITEILECNPSNEKAVINVRNSSNGRYRRID